MDPICSMNPLPLRTACCHFRKVRPLNRKLAGFDAWLTGLRRSQSDTRESLNKIAPEQDRAQDQPAGGLDT